MFSSLSLGQLTPGLRWLLSTILVLIVLLGVVACAPQKIEPATAFSLDDSNGRQVVLTRLLEKQDAVVLVFYRGFF